MVFDQIETLKREYTDKYVVVDGGRPELARFDGHVGVVKTVNMNGRALVEFENYIANIGWFDIALDFLKVVPKPDAEEPTAREEKLVAKKAVPAKPVAKSVTERPPEKPAEQKPAAAGEKKLSPIELARMQGAAKREGAPAVAKPKPEAADAATAAAKLMAAQPSAGKKSSTADILAAARTKKPTAPPSDSSEAPAAGATATAPAEPTTVAKETATIAPEPAAQTPMKTTVNAPATGPKPTNTVEKIAWCRRFDEGRNTR